MFEIKMPTGAGALLYILNQSARYHADAYIVGGCVRDSLLGKTPNDWDICTSAKPDRVLAVMKEYNIRTIETGLKHGTVTALMYDGQYEITTFRIDGDYSDNRRPDSVEFVDDIKADLSRRDFTINAMAYDRWDGLIDPFGGYTDLRMGVIRCVGNPDDRFGEDALRIMRALRFASTYGFTIEEKTAEAIHKNKDLLNNIAVERIQSELMKMLCGKGVLDILLEYKDVMAVIIPELGPCIGFDQNNRYHKYDVYDHIAHAVANYYLGSDISIKMALLLHDIGKPLCYTEDHNGGHFHGHGGFSKWYAERIMERLRFDNKTRDEVVTLVGYHDADIHPSVNAVKRWLNKIGYDMLKKLLLVEMSDIMAHSEINRKERLAICLQVRAIAEKIVAEQRCFQIKDLAINGHDVMGLGVPSGPVVGRVLNHLLDWVLDERIENERDALLEEARRYLKYV